MAGGGPLSSPELIRQIELPTNVNAKLTEFSFNFAMQEDGRFDEVGPAGETLWFCEGLNRKRFKIRLSIALQPGGI